MKRNGLALAVLVLLAAILAGCSSGVDTSSKSYVDGYRVGYQNERISGTYPDGAQACQADLGVVYPTGDNQATYIAGCTAGYNDARAGKQSAVALPTGETARSSAGGSKASASSPPGTSAPPRLRPPVGRVAQMLTNQEARYPPFPVRRPHFAQR